MTSANDIIEIRQADMLQAINRAEVDIQIATAKQYPRNINEVLNRIKTYATMDTETAEDCFYALRRGGNVIEGISVRLAEIIAGAWGNLRVQSRIIGNDGKTITCQGICHDLETNLAVSVEVKRSITDKLGKTFSEDMQVVTGNAASAIAFRNAVLKVVPKAVTKKVISDIRKVALGQALDLETRRQNMVITFTQKFGVTMPELLAYCGVKAIEQIDNQKVYELRGLANAIKEGTTSVQETFRSGAAGTRTSLEEQTAARMQQRAAAAKPAQAAAPTATDIFATTADDDSKPEDNTKDKKTKEEKK